MIAFGGLSWALDGAAAPAAAVLRLEPAMAQAGRARAAARTAASAAGLPAREIRFRDVTLRLPERGAARARGLRPRDPRRLVARHRRPERRRQDDAREAPLPALRPAGRRDRGRRRRPARARRRGLARARDRRLPGLHPLRAAAARQRGAGRRARRRRSAPRSRRPAPRSSPTSTPCSRAATRAAPISRAGSGSGSRSRARSAPCASARASCCSTSRPRSSTCAARPRSSTAILAATRHATTILISHRFSTVRHADRICVLEDGRVVELGSHDELMALGGRYRTMFELQASRFGEDDAGGGGARCPRLTTSRRAVLDVAGARSAATRPSRCCSRSSFGLSLLAALPDALIALWLKLLADGVPAGERGLVLAAALGLGASSVATWFLSLISDAHPAPLPRPRDDRARVARGASSRRRWRPSSTTSARSYLDRLAVLRNQVFVLDHMYLSLFTTCGWVLRLAVTLALLDLDPPGARAPRRVRAADRADLDLAAGRRARGGGARRLGAAARAPSLRHGDHRAARARRCA